MRRCSQVLKIPTSETFILLCVSAELISELFPNSGHCGALPCSLTDLWHLTLVIMIKHFIQYKLF